jgi:hypothetical protein
MVRFRPLLWPTVVIVLAIGAFARVQHQRGELVDFAVPRTAAIRALGGESLYRPDDGHYQYKYLPAFAVLMAPFALMPKVIGEAIWFALLVVMAWWFVRLSARALPDRRTPVSNLVWWTILLNGKFLVKELAFGQFNLPLGLLLMGAVIAAQRKRDATAGLLAGAGVFIKPYALVLLPWLMLTRRWRAPAAFGAAMAVGLLVPIVSYGWTGNLHLLHEWYRTVTQTTAPNLLGFENLSFASMWAKWLGPGPSAALLAAASSVVAFAAGLGLMAWRRHVSQPGYLEAGYFLVLVPLLSPQGWDYVLLLAIPAYMMVLDRWAELPSLWRVAMGVGFALTSFTIFDLLGRTLYFQVMQWAVASIGAIIMLAVLVKIRAMRGG